jgi:beta-galactosidase
VIPVAIQPSGNLTRIAGPDFSLIFDRIRGTIASYTFQGVKLLDRGPLPDFWRAMTDNDYGAWKSIANRARQNPEQDITAWRDAGPGWNATGFETSRLSPTTVTVTVTGELPGTGATATLLYNVEGTGRVSVTARYTPGDAPRAMMPRVGTELVVSPGLEHVEWLGRGPDETYADRQFAPVGRYRSTVREQFVDYPRPQENGNKTGVQWLSLTNDDGVGLMVRMAENGAPLSVGASHYTKADLEAAQYSFQLPRRPEIYLNVDLKQMGVGGNNSWSTVGWPLEAYRIPSDQPYEFTYTMMPVRSVR